MSGFEIAGVVLGALPIVIEGLSAYRAGKGLLATIRRFHGLVDDLIHQLKTHKTNFYLDILQLLREARVEAILDDLDPTEEVCMEVLFNARTGKEISRYLGHLQPQFLETLGYYENYLKEIVSRLETIVRPKAAAKDDLRAIIRAHADPKSGINVGGRLKFAMDRKTLEMLVKDLGTERYSLGKLIKQLKTQRDWEAREASGESKRLAKSFVEIQARVASLQKAASQSWVCPCHDYRVFMMRLENRIVWQGRTHQQRQVIFRLCFPADVDTLQEVEVRATANSYSQENPILYRQPSGDHIGPKRRKGNHSGKLQVPTIAITANYSNTTTALISNPQIASLCEKARKAYQGRQILALELASDGLAVSEETIQSQTSFKSTVTLADFLTLASQNHNHGARLTPKQQTLLALDVATAVLQLRHTTWAATPWNSTTIKFLVDQKNNNNNNNNNNGRGTTHLEPFVNQTTDDTILAKQLGDLSLSTKATKATILEIAILLLEILHHRSLESWAAEHPCNSTGNKAAAATTFWERLEVATRWVEVSSDKLLPDHLRAVEACLTQCVRGNASWRDSEFQEVYCENVVKPLRRLVMPIGAC